MRAWRSSRERVADASSRHLAVSPPRLLAVAATTHTSFSVTLLVLRTPLCCVLFHSVFLYDVLVLLYMYSTSLSLRVAARIFAFQSHYSCVRRAAAPSVITFVSVFAERFAPHLCRVALISCASLSLRHLIESRYLVLKLCIIRYRAVRRGLDRTPASRPCLLALIFIAVLIASPAAAFPRSKSARLCYSRLANTTRSAVRRLNRIDSPPRL